MIEIVLITLGAVLIVCMAAFVFKTKLGGSGGYKDKHPPRGMN